VFITGQLASHVLANRFLHAHFQKNLGDDYIGVK
jgi:hypothetical protein